MKYLIELVANSEGLEPAITGIEELNAKEKELKSTTAQVSAEQKKMMDDYATKAKLGKASIDKLTEGYKNLGKAATGAFGGEAIKGAVKSTESFRSQLRLSRDELTRLLQTGKATTSEIYNMARGAGALKDSVKDAAQVISVLSSDTFKFDATLQGLQVGAAGFQVMAGAAALAGEESEELQKTLVKLNAIMAITAGIQQIINLTQKESAFRLGVSVLWNKLLGNTYDKQTGALIRATFATKAFRVALAATGIGLLILAVGYLISNFDRLKTSSGLLGKSMQLLGNIVDGLFLGFAKLTDAIGFTNSAADKLAEDNKRRKAEEIADIERNDALIIALMKARGENTKEEEIKQNKEKRERLRLELKGLLDDETKAGKERKAEILKQRDELADANAVLFEEIRTEQKDAAKKQAEDDKEAFLKRKAELDKRAKEEQAVQEKLNQQYKDSLKNRRDLEAAAEAKALQERIKESELRLKLTRDTLKHDEDLYKESLKNRRELEAENAKILEERRIAESQKRFEARRSEIELEIELEKEKQEAIKSTAIEVAQITADTIFQIVNTNRNNEFNAQIQRLNELKDRELSNKELTDAQKERIELRYQKQLAAIKTKQAKADKQAALVQAVINGALAISKIAATIPPVTPLGTPNPAYIVALVIAAATTAAQIAVIGATEIPKFAKGTEFVHGSGTETSDSVPAMLSKGERVIDAKTNKLLKGIPNKLIPDLLMPKITTISDGMDYDRLAKAFSKELANNPALMVNFDKQGFTSFIKSGVTVSQIKNNRNGI